MYYNDRLNGRIAWIDALKMFAMLFVIFYHCKYIQSPNLIGYNYLNLWIVSFNMPLFVFLSGLTSYKGLNALCSWKDFFNYIEKISKRIALPNVCFSCIVGFFLHSFVSYNLFRASLNIGVFSFFFIIIVFKDKCKGVSRLYNWIMLLPFVMNIVGVYSYFWFLAMLLFVLGGTAFSIVLVRKCNINYAWVAGCVAFLIMLLCGGNFNNTEEMIPYFLIGCFCARKKYFEKYDFKSKPSFPICVLLFFIGVLLFLFYYDHDFYRFHLMTLIKMGLFYEYFIRVLCGLIFVFLFCLLFMRKYTEYGVLAKLGTNTLAFYMIHAQIIRVLRYNFLFENDNWYMWFVAILIAFMIMLVSYFFILILQRWKISRTLFGVVI